MLIRFMNHGTGSAAAAADYLTRAEDWKGQEREDIQVLRGDPRQVADVADSLEFKHKYTSAVLAWAPEDQPTDEQIELTVDEFERFAWAGMEPDRYAWTAVKHRNPDGGVHVHVVAARCDLATGKSLNIAPPGCERQYNALRDSLDREHGWSSPADPERARAVRPGHHAYLDVAVRALRAADGGADRDAQQLVRAAVVLGRAGHAATRRRRRRQPIEKALVRARMAAMKNPRRVLTRFLRQEIERGTVTDRTSMVATLKQAGFDVTRQGKDYFTVADRDSGQRWRLKGAIYGEGFQRERFIQEDGRDKSAARERALGESESARAELERHRSNRARYFRQRYRITDIGPREAAGGSATVPPGPETEGPSRESDDRARTPVDERLEGVGRAVQEGSAAAHRASRSLGRAGGQLGRRLQEDRRCIDSYTRALEQVVSRDSPYRRPRRPSRPGRSR